VAVRNGAPARRRRGAPRASRCFGVCAAAGPAGTPSAASAQAPFARHAFAAGRARRAAIPTTNREGISTMPTKPLAPADPTSPRPSLSDVRTLRERARRHVEAGAVTPGYAADAAEVCAALNDALATELVCVLRYRRHYFMATGLASDSVKQEFIAHAGEELAHADRLATRIVQLGGAPDFDPAGLAARSHAEYATGASLRDMIREDLVAERVAIESYREIIAWLGDRDATTRKLVEDILAVEEEHAEDMASLLGGLDDV
jgi:bacterioferritin